MAFSRSIWHTECAKAVNDYAAQTYPLVTLPKDGFWFKTTSGITTGFAMVDYAGESEKVGLTLNENQIRDALMAHYNNAYKMFTVSRVILRTEKGKLFADLTLTPRDDNPTQQTST